MLGKRPFPQLLDPVKLVGQAKPNAPNVSTVMWPGSYLVKLVGMAVAKRPYPGKLSPFVTGGLPPIIRTQYHRWSTPSPARRVGGCCSCSGFSYLNFGLRDLSGEGVVDWLPLIRPFVRLAGPVKLLGLAVAKRP